MSTSSTPTGNSTTSKSHPVIITFSILAGLMVINAGLALIDSINKDVTSIISLVIAGITAAATFYVEAQTAPWKDVVSKLAPDGSVVAGPAAGPTSSPLPPV